MDRIYRLSLYLSRRSRRSLLAITGLAVVASWLFDYLTGPALAVSLFYLLPVAFASWFLGRRAGLLTAVVCGAGWLLNVLVTSPNDDEMFFLIWGAGIRLATFLVVSLILSTLREARTRQEELLSFLVHDLRTPVFNMMSSLEMIHHANAGGDRNGIEQFADMGLLSGNDMLILIDSLLDLTRLENRRMPVEVQAVPVRPMVEKAIQQVHAMSVQQRVHIAMQTADGVGAVRADPALLQRVLVNLLSNAIKFSPKDSTVRVHAQPLEGRRLQITIADEGPGLPDDWQQRAFDKYSQLRGRKTGHARGSGLGLAFCSLAVEAQSGQIRLESGETAGTTAYVVLPMV